MAKICCVGLCCMDHIFSVERLPSAGGKHFATGYAGAVGGPAAVAAMTVASLGHEAVFLGRLGNDATGRALVGSLTARGVDASGVRLVPGGASQISAVVVDKAGERMIINYGAAGRPGSGLDPDASWLPLQRIAEADVLLVDVRWPEGAAAALDKARALGIPSVIDADIAPYDTTALVSRADHIVFSEAGLALVAKTEEIEDGLRQASALTGRRVAVTRGEVGCSWLEGGEFTHLPGFAVTAVDTLCAGDVFHGAFAVALAEKRSYPEAVTFAAAAAALKCTRFGGSAGVPDRAAVESFLQEHARPAG